MTAFELTCPCGQTLRGERRRGHQVAPCPACGRTHFVLPVSPYDEAAPAARPARSWWRSWRTAILAAATAAVLLVGFFVAWPFRERRPAPPDESDDAERLTADRDAGHRALTQGRFRLGWKMIDGVVRRRNRRPGLLSAEQNRDLNQLHRQADLLARLLTRFLEDVVRQGALVRDPQEWAAQFDDYRGRTVLLDDRLRLDEAGRPALTDPVVEVPGETVRLAVEELEVLHDLPLADAPRVIFGARLASCRREKGGVWVVRFEPDSGVLLTDPELWEACVPAAIDDEVRRTLARQRQWLDEAGVVHPARAGP